MIIEIENFREVIYDDGQKIYFDKKYSFHDHFEHKRKVKKFPFHKNILLFLKENPEISIFFTLNEEVRSFQKIEQGFLINMIAFSNFCKTIGSQTGGRTKAFLGKNLNIQDVSFTETDKDEFIKINASEKNIVEAINSFDPVIREKIIKSVNSIETSEVNTHEGIEINQTEFLKAFSRFLTDSKTQEIIIANYPQIQINILEEHKKFLENNLDKEEIFIQNWIDGTIDNSGITIELSEEDRIKLQKSRRLIFGLEFTGHEREVLDSGQKMDILARINLEKNKREYTLFELKSPNATIFVDEDKELKLSPKISRAIPQVLDYKADFEEKKDGDADLNRKNLPSGKIVKCIIVIGKQSENERNKKIFRSLKENFSSLIEIWTYTDLINRLETTIQNLKENL